MEKPGRTLSTLDAAALVVGIVVGAGILLLPPVVASNVAGPRTFVAVWLTGGLISLIGALCYAELAATYPNTGGDYYFLMRAFGAGPAFLFAWARMMVIQPGAIALFGFAIGDYLANALSESPQGGGSISAIVAASVVFALTVINVAGVRQGKWTQVVLTSLVVIGLLMIVAAGGVAVARGRVVDVVPGAPGSNSLGTAMIFVLFTYSGWNEAAYLSGEMKGDRKRIVVAMLVGIAVVTALYLLVNLAYLAVLGFVGLQKSSAVAADALGVVWGAPAALFITAILVVAASSSANATVFTGARSNYALGRDFALLRFLGRWNDRTGSPTNALLVQGFIALALVSWGAANREGVKTMVEYTSPVFWFFFLLVGVALFVLRRREPGVERPFRVPFYPILPAIFCAVAGYLFYASLMYYQRGALVGVGVLLAGVPVMLLAFAMPGRPATGAHVATGAKLDTTEVE